MHLGRHADTCTPPEAFAEEVFVQLLHLLGAFFNLLHARTRFRQLITQLYFTLLF